MNKFTLDELQMRQALPLSMKVAMTKTRIRDWVDYYGTDGVYVSFSGGKDSTVLLHIVRELYPNIEAVFVDTGLEYPEIREFVKTFENVTWLKPKKTFKQVILEYGYPFISKDVSQVLNECQKKIVNNGMPPSYRMKRLNGELTDKDGKPSQFNIQQWKFMLESPWMFSHKCCNVMKKSPVKIYEHKTGKKPIMAMMASESRLRTQQWLKNGCNAWDGDRPKSNPMSFWTEQDVLLYIKEHNLPICSVYGEIVIDDGIEDGQMCIADYAEECGLFDLGNPPLTTTGCKRTGCMFCGFGCHLEKDGKGRFELMKETHPKQYDYIMRPIEDGGLDYKNIIDWLNEHGNLSIKY